MVLFWEEWKKSGGIYIIDAVGKKRPFSNMR